MILVQLLLFFQCSEYCAFMKPLEGGRGRKLLMREEPVNNTATVLYVGRIPHGFYEEQMEGNCWCSF